eukprot:gene20843-27675_t
MDSAASANSADGSDSSACSTRSPSDSKGTTLVESEPAVRTSAVHPESTNQDKAGVDPETPDQDPTATGPASPTKHQAGASADGPIQDQSGAGPPSMASDQGDTDVGSREQEDDGNTSVPPSAGPLPQADSMALGDNLGVSIGVEELAQQGGEPPYLDPPVDLVAAHTELSGDSILDGAQLPGVGEDTPADEPPPQGPVASLSPDAEAGSYPSADCGENQAPSDASSSPTRRSSSDRFRAKVLLASEAAGDGEVSPPTTIKSAGSLRSSDASAVGAGPLHCPEKQGVRSDSAPAASKKATVHGGSLPSSNPSISTPSLQAKAAAPSPKTPSPSPKEPHPGSTQVVSTAALESFMRPTSSSNMKVISEPPSSTKKSGLTGTLRRTASETSTPSKPARMRRTSSGGSAPAPSSASSRNLNSTSPAPHTTASSPKSSSSALADGDLGGQLPPVLYPQAASEHARLKLGGNPAPSNATFCTPSETARKRTLSIKEQVARMALDRRFFHLGRQLGTGSFATVYLAGVVLPEGVSATEALRPSQDCGNGGDEPKPPALAPGPLDLDNSAVDTPTAAATSLTLDLLHSLKSNKQLVVKKLDRLQGSSNVDVMNEISVMQQAGSHPNLVHFKGWYRDEAGVLAGP